MKNVETIPTRFFKLDQNQEGFLLENGTLIKDAVLAYETYGKLNADGSNAILVFHALSGSQHAAGWNPNVPEAGDFWTDECHSGWWDDFIGEGKSLDTSDCFVVCANYLGGCYGSTGPSSVHPDTGLPYGSTFPRITLLDIVRSQMKLIDHLGIQKLRAVVGASLGGILTQILATRYPDRVETVIPIATGLCITPLQRLQNLEQIVAIESDPNFNGGDYYTGPRPVKGLTLARIIGHKTYVSLVTLQERARQDVTRTDHLPWYNLHSSLESYMLHQGSKFVKRFDANTYLRILDAWQSLDLLNGSGLETYKDLFSRCRNQKFLLFTIDSDVCFYPDEQADLYQNLKHAGVETTRITVHSDKGHDSFLLEPHLYQPYLRNTLMLNS